MTAAQFEDLRVDEAAEVLAWRFDALCRSGYDLDAAAVLAANVEVDLHDAVGLVAARLPARARDENSRSSLFASGIPQERNPTA